MGGGSPEPPPPVLHAPIAHASPSPSPPRSPNHPNCRPPHTPLPPSPATLAPEQECRTMPLFPQRRRPTLPAVNPTLTNADQIVTKVDTRLTKVDKTDHRQPPSHPQTPAKHSTITTAPTIPPPPVSTSVVNPSGAPRTDPNNPEHHRTPRPDRTTLRNTPEHPEKNQS